MTDRLRRVMAVWNWLPAVRVVAEFESVQRAARELAVSPSALSRTIKLAEDAVGAPLFVRAASGISLTAAGEKMLASIRTAMRVVDDGLESLVRLPTGRFVAAYSGPVAERALATAAAALFGLPAASGQRLELRRIDVERVSAELLRGHVDFVLAEQPVSFAEVSTSFVADVRFGIFRPRGGAEDTDAPVVRLAGGVEAGFSSDGLYGVERAAIRTGHRAELPVALADAALELVGPSPRSTSLHVVRRRSLDERAALGDHLVALVRELATSLDESDSRPD